MIDTHHHHQLGQKNWPKMELRNKVYNKRKQKGRTDKENENHSSHCLSSCLTFFFTKLRVINAVSPMHQGKTEDGKVHSHILMEVSFKLRSVLLQILCSFSQAKARILLGRLF